MQVILVQLNCVAVSQVKWPQRQEESNPQEGWKPVTSRCQTRSVRASAAVVLSAGHHTLTHLQLGHDPVAVVFLLFDGRGHDGRGGQGWRGGLVRFGERWWRRVLYRPLVEGDTLTLHHPTWQLSSAAQIVQDI